MTIDIAINNTGSPRGRYLSWASSPCMIRLTNPLGFPLPVTIKLRNKPGGTGGKVVFRKTATGPAAATLSLNLQSSGTAVGFFMAGRFGSASVTDGDAIVQAVRGTTVLAEVKLMVRIRKDATRLTPAERDRFVAAFAALNNNGAGRFTDFRNIHTAAGSPEAHGAPGFLPWHRAYLLDLERELQAIDPSVALPYWRFDRPAASIFTPEFLGVADNLGTVAFAPGNPLQFWRTDGVPGINRRPGFNTATQSAFVMGEAATLGLGSTYAAFRVMEGDPHGSAHTSFGGFISSIPTAARDPLFFLLHANVDRLWAKWQRANQRFDTSQAATFDSHPPAGNRVGHNLNDSMWPWNGIITTPRPPTAPGGGLASSPCASAPGPQPLVRQSIDYQGRLANNARLGFDYDDVRYL